MALLLPPAAAAAAARDPVTPEGRSGPVTPEPWASGAPSQAQPLLRQEANEEEEEEGEETGVRGAWGTGTAEQRRRGWGRPPRRPRPRRGRRRPGAPRRRGRAPRRVARVAAARAGRGSWAGCGGGSPSAAPVRRPFPAPPRTVVMEEPRWRLWPTTWASERSTTTSA